MLISRDFKFDSAHYLPKYKGKCERLHGHTYKMRVTLEGEPDHEGMIFDFVEMKEIINELVVSKLDHYEINQIIPNPSAENIAVWVWEQISGKFRDAKLVKVKIWETADCYVTYSG